MYKSIVIWTRIIFITLPSKTSNAILFWGSNLTHFLENSFKLVPYLLHFKIVLILLGHCLNIILFKLHVVKISDINQPDL